MSERWEEIRNEIFDMKTDLFNEFDKVNKKIDNLMNLYNAKSFFLPGEKSPAVGDIPERKTLKKESTKNGKITEKVESKLVIEHEGRTYSRFNPCKYKCGMWSSFANDYKKGDRPIHINPVTKEVLGGCPKYE